MKTHPSRIENVSVAILTPILLLVLAFLSHYLVSFLLQII